MFPRAHLIRHLKKEDLDLCRLCVKLLMIHQSDVFPSVCHGGEAKVAVTPKKGTTTTIVTDARMYNFLFPFAAH